MAHVKTGAMLPIIYTKDLPEPLVELMIYDEKQVPWEEGPALKKAGDRIPIFFKCKQLIIIL